MPDGCVYHHRCHQHRLHPLMFSTGDRGCYHRKRSTSVVVSVALVASLIACILECVAGVGHPVNVTTRRRVGATSLKSTFRGMFIHDADLEPSSVVEGRPITSVPDSPLESHFNRSVLGQSETQRKLSATLSAEDPISSARSTKLIEVIPYSTRTVPTSNVITDGRSASGEILASASMTSSLMTSRRDLIADDASTGSSASTQPETLTSEADVGRRFPIALNTTTPEEHRPLERRLPQVIIIGVKKGGTRALLEFLRIHPDVRAVGPEVHFFDRNYDRGLDWYKRMMPLTFENQLTIEKTPSYFVTTRVAERVRQMSPNVRLIVVLRDPVSRALSDYAQASAKKSGLPLFERLAFHPVDDVNSVSGFRAGNQSYGEVNSTWRALQIGLYDVHLRPWMKHFSRERIHFVSGEHLVADPASTVTDVQRFLGLRPLITESNFRSSAVKPGFPCLVRDPGTAGAVVRCLGKTKGRRHPHVERRAVERLREFFRPHNEKLYRMTGIDFGWQ